MRWFQSICHYSNVLIAAQGNRAWINTLLLILLVKCNWFSKECQKEMPCILTLACFFSFLCNRKNKKDHLLFNQMPSLKSFPNLFWFKKEVLFKIHVCLWAQQSRSVLKHVQNEKLVENLNWQNERGQTLAINVTKHS